MLKDTQAGPKVKGYPKRPAGLGNVKEVYQVRLGQV